MTVVKFDEQTNVVFVFDLRLIMSNEYREIARP